MRTSWIFRRKRRRFLIHWMIERTVVSLDCVFSARPKSTSSKSPYRDRCECNSAHTPLFCNNSSTTSNRLLITVYWLSGCRRIVPGSWTGRVKTSGVAAFLRLCAFGRGWNRGSFWRSGNWYWRRAPSASGRSNSGRDCPWSLWVNSTFLSNLSIQPVTNGSGREYSGCIRGISLRSTRKMMEESQVIQRRQEKGISFPCPVLRWGDYSPPTTAYFIFEYHQVK